MRIIIACVLLYGALGIASIVSLAVLLLMIPTQVRPPLTASFLRVLCLEGDSFVWKETGSVGVPNRKG